MTKQELIQQIETMTNDEKLELHNEYQWEYGNPDTAIYSIEEINDLFCDVSPLELLETFEGKFNSSAEYFTWNGGIWLEFGDLEDMLDMNFYAEDIADYLIDRDALDVVA